MYEGGSMRIMIGGKKIFHEISAKFSTSKDFKETASKDTGGKTSTPGTKGWSLTANTLVANSAAQAEEDLASLLAAYNNDDLLAVQFVSDVAGETGISGNVYIESIAIDSTNDEIVTGDFSFKGDGDFTVITAA